MPTPAVPFVDLMGWSLRALEVADAEPWFRIVQETELRRLTSWSVATVEDMRANLSAVIDGPRSSTTRRWAIVDAGGAFSGTCGFKDWDRTEHSAELVYELARRHRGQGAMTAVAGAVVAYGLGQMGLHVVHALVMTQNRASIRLLDKLGFVQTAVLSAHRSCGGVMSDFYRYERSSAP